MCNFMVKRINITLKSETLERLERQVAKGARSQFIDQAIQYYLAQIQKETLHQQVKAGAMHRAERDQHLAQEWSALEGHRGSETFKR
jgi:CopG family transcriptional regulator / antitoxin EndoAI